MFSPIDSFCKFDQSPLVRYFMLSSDREHLSSYKLNLLRPNSWIWIGKLHLTRNWTPFLPILLPSKWFNIYLSIATSGFLFISSESLNDIFFTTPFSSILQSTTYWFLINSTLFLRTHRFSSNFLTIFYNYPSILICSPHTFSVFPRTYYSTGWVELSFLTLQSWSHFPSQTCYSYFDYEYFWRGWSKLRKRDWSKSCSYRPINFF